MTKTTTDGWIKSHTGWHCNGYRIRRVSGKTPLFWVYDLNGDRFYADGSYDSAVSFISLAKAKKYIKEIS
jgi:hypothetical protein